MLDFEFFTYVPTLKRGWFFGIVSQTPFDFYYEFVKELTSSQAFIQAVEDNDEQTKKTVIVEILQKLAKDVDLTPFADEEDFEESLKQLKEDLFEVLPFIFNRKVEKTSKFYISSEYDEDGIKYEFVVTENMMLTA
jgi:hypothetical protein